MMDQPNLEIFTETNPDFNINIALWLAKFSKISYKNKKNTSKELKQIGFRKIIFFDKKGTQAYLALHKKFGILAFRGTQFDYKDILVHIYFFRKKTRDGKYNVHSGFLKALNYVWFPGLKESLEKIKLPMYYTGHSLGGALAVLAANRIKPKCLYTFGSPRVVGKKLSSELMKRMKIYRVINSIDIITLLPFFHQHAGNPIYIDGNGKIRKSNYKLTMVLEYMKNFFSLTTLLLPNLLVKRIKPKILTNHKINEYIRKLRN